MISFVFRIVQYLESLLVSNFGLDDLPIDWLMKSSQHHFFPQMLTWKILAQMTEEQQASLEILKKSSLWFKFNFVLSCQNVPKNFLEVPISGSRRCAKAPCPSSDWYQPRSMANEIPRGLLMANHITNVQILSFALQFHFQYWKDLCCCFCSAVFCAPWKRVDKPKVRFQQNNFFFGKKIEFDSFCSENFCYDIIHISKLRLG